MHGSKYRKSGLGRGIEALLGEEEVSRTIYGASKRDVAASPGLPSSPLREVDIRLVAPNPHQPRKHFHAQELEELAASIRRDGLLQPIVVSKQKNIYYVVAGERRLRAAKRAGLSKVPVLIKDVDDKDRLRLALVENIQRSNLNVMEEALAYKNLMENFALSQVECGDLVGKDRSTIANVIRLLDLPESLYAEVAGGGLSSGHARALLSLESSHEQTEVAALIKERKMTVRETEDLCRARKKQKVGKYKKRGGANKVVDANLQHLADSLRESLGTKVTLEGTSQRGTIKVHYYSAEELERLVASVGQ